MQAILRRDAKILVSRWVEESKQNTPKHCQVRQEKVFDQKCSPLTKQADLSLMKQAMLMKQADVLLANDVEEERRKWRRGEFWTFTIRFT